MIFATYWFYPAKTEMILPEDHECIEKKMAQQLVRFDPKSKFLTQANKGWTYSSPLCLQLVVVAGIKFLVTAQSKY